MLMNCYRRWDFMNTGKSYRTSCRAGSSRERQSEGQLSKIRIFCSATGALDYNTSKDILELIERVNQKYGNTVIMVTHNDAIKDMADIVIRLRDGAVRKSYRNEKKIPARELDW